MRSADRQSLAQLPGYREPVREVCLSTLLHTRTADDLKKANVALTAKPSALIDDFAHDLRDWYVLNGGNLTHQQLWTRKITDPLWRGPNGAQLRITLKMPQTNRLSFVLQQNEWRSYRGPRRTFVCQREIPGAEGEQAVVLSVQDFSSPDGSPASWSALDQFGICAHFAAPGASTGDVPLWKGSAPQFLRMAWEH